MEAHAALPELASVWWRRPVDEGLLRRRELVWAAYMVVGVAPFVGFAAVLVLLEPLLAPVALISLFHGWVIPELFANRGSRVLLPAVAAPGGAPERTAQGLLGDLLRHEQRDLQRRTGLVVEDGRFGIWIVGEAGALLVRRGGRRVHAFCAHVTDDALPPADRIAHLLLALREDETGFATVANPAFTGALWRMRRRLRPNQREALAAARRSARGAPLDERSS